MTLSPRLYLPPRTLWLRDWPYNVLVKVTCKITEKSLLFQIDPTRARAADIPPDTGSAGQPPTGGRQIKTLAG
jgi:hypothetical protein